MYFCEACMLHAVLGFAWLQNVFKTGAVLAFKSEASDKNLQAMDDGDVQGKGGEDEKGKDCARVNHGLYGTHLANNQIFLEPFSHSYATQPLAVHMYSINKLALSWLYPACF